MGWSALEEAGASGGGAELEAGGGALCCDEEGAEGAPAEATASGGWYCCVA